MSYTRMIEYSKENFNKIKTISREGYPEARKYTRTSQMGQSLAAACKNADLSKGPYYWRGHMCMGAATTLDYDGKYKVVYWPLFGREE